LQSNIPIKAGTITIHILKISPAIRKLLSLPISKSFSSRDKALIRTNRDEIMRNLGAHSDLHFGTRRKDTEGEVRRVGGREGGGGGGGMNRGAGLRPRNISWSSMDLRRCGQPILRTLSVDPI